MTTAQRVELEALRRRAYARDADIESDHAALARLEELEDALRRDRMPHAPAPPALEASDDSLIAPAIRMPHAPAPEPSDEPLLAPVIPSPESPAPVSGPPLSPRRRVALLAGLAAVAIVLVAALWSATRSQGPSAETPIPIVSDQPWSMSSRSGYELYLDNLREGFLDSPGLALIADRIIRDSLRPYGDLYGRTVWAAATIDGQYVMIVDDSPDPQFVFVSTDPAYASAQSVSLSVTAAAGAPPSAAFVVYTLLPNGRVTVAPAAP